MSINRLFDELVTLALAEFDSETRFRIMAARGSKRTGMALLNKLDRAFAGKREPLDQPGESRLPPIAGTDSAA